jgi:uncharacterized protein YqhQ
VDPAASLRTFDRRQLPKLGGMARPDGVTIVSERFWAFAGTDGTLRSGEMPRIPNEIKKIPLLRGLAKLSLAVAPLFRPGGVAPVRERVLLAAALALSFVLPLFAGTVALVAGIVVACGLMGWMLRGRTLFLHGAEHRAIAAAERSELTATWTGAATPSRFSPRCGTNFAALAVGVSLLAERVTPLPPSFYASGAVVLVSLALTMELWVAVQASASSAARLFLLPGLALQRLTTREPSLDETRTALRAVDSVLGRELGQTGSD